MARLDFNNKLEVLEVVSEGGVVYHFTVRRIPAVQFKAFKQRTIELNEEFQSAAEEGREDTGRYLVEGIALNCSVKRVGSGLTGLFYRSARVLFGDRMDKRAAGTDFTVGQLEQIMTEVTRLAGFRTEEEKKTA